MVKVSFNSALGQKDAKKEGNNEALIPEYKDPEDSVRVRPQSKAWCWCMCLGLALILSGVVVVGAYLYRYFKLQLQEGQVFVCGLNYREEDFMVPEEEVDLDLPSQLRRIQEKIRVWEEEEVELINVPVPEFADSDPADIVHDFPRKLTAYMDLTLNKCYVIPLNTSIVMPPKDFLELVLNIKPLNLEKALLFIPLDNYYQAGTYLPQSYLIHEEMIVTERVDDVDQLGYFIYKLCRGKDTYRLQRRDTILGMQKREALNCFKITHFENKFVVETQICEP